MSSNRPPSQPRVMFVGDPDQARPAAVHWRFGAGELPPMAEPDIICWNEGGARVVQIKELKILAIHPLTRQDVEDLESSSDSGVADPPDPPLVAEFLPKLVARSSLDEAEAGCIQQAFTRNSRERGMWRALWLYWADVLGYLLRRAFRAAVLIGMLKRLFG